MKLHYLIVVTLVLTQSAHGAGFYNPDQSSAGTAQGQAFSAQADDASAIWYNPAGLTQQTGTHLTAGSYALFTRTKFDGTIASAVNQEWNFVPHLYAATDFKQERWRFGLGINVPFGTGSEWDENGIFRYVETKSQLMVVNFSPTVAYRVNDQLSVGASLNVYRGETELERHEDFSAFDAPDGRFRFKGDGYAVGATVAVLWKVNAQHSVGVTYRSPFRIGFDGEATLRGTPLGDFASNDAHIALEFPQMVTVGYAYRATEKLTLSADVQWLNWDTLNTPRLSATGMPFDDTPLAFDYHDSVLVGAGVQYRLSERWRLRAGYSFIQNSVPDRTFSPSLPDSDQHVGSIGVEYGTTRWHIALAYQYSYFVGRTVTGNINSPVVDGRWQTDGHAVNLSAVWQF